MNYEIIINTLMNSVYFLRDFTILTTTGYFIAKGIQLHRISPYNGKTIANQNFILNKLNSLKEEQIDFDKRETLKPYVLKLYDYIPESDRKIIANNIKTLEIRKKPLLLLEGNSASYSIEKNVLSLGLKSAFEFEFLQVASSIYDKESGISLLGFEQEKDSRYLGTGLNAGYTELLASRIYNKKLKINYILAKIASMIEFFFDDPKDMAHLYFTCDLPGLIKHLEQYAPKEEIMKLIIDMDSTYLANIACTPLIFIKSIQMQMKLWNWFQKKCQDKEKRKQFEALACKNKVVSLLINRKKLVLKQESLIKSSQFVIVKSSETRKQDTTTLKPQPKNTLDVLSKEEKEALKEMLQVEKIESLPSGTIDISLQKSILEDVKAMLVEDNQQLDSEKQL